MFYTALGSADEDPFPGGSTGWMFLIHTMARWFLYAGTNWLLPIAAHHTPLFVLFLGLLFLFGQPPCFSASPAAILLLFDHPRGKCTLFKACFTQWNFWCRFDPPWPFARLHLPAGPPGQASNTPRFDCFFFFVGPFFFACFCTRPP